jgi:hypothetical protein
MAPSSAANRTPGVANCSLIMPLPTVFATPVPKEKAAMKLKKAAQQTAWKGVNTRVETTVATELAAS